MLHCQLILVVGIIILFSPSYLAASGENVFRWLVVFFFSFFSVQPTRKRRRKFLHHCQSHEASTKSQLDDSETVRVREEENGTKELLVSCTSTFLRRVSSNSHTVTVTVSKLNVAVTFRNTFLEARFTHTHTHTHNYSSIYLHLLNRTPPKDKHEWTNGK